VDNNADFSSPTVNTTVDNTAYTPPTALVDRVYSWRVRTVDHAGNKSAWSAIWTVRVDVEPTPVPGLVSPTNESATKDTTPLLRGAP